MNTVPKQGHESFFIHTMYILLIVYFSVFCIQIENIIFLNNINNKSLNNYLGIGRKSISHHHRIYTYVVQYLLNLIKKINNI